VQHHGPGDSLSFRFRATGVALLTAHLLLVSWIALRPLSVPWVPATNLRPLSTIRAELAHGPMEAVQALGPPLLLLAPLGVLLPVVTGRLVGSWLGSFAHTVFTGALVALVIGLLQTDVPGHMLDVDAILLNTTGVVLAHLVLTPPLRASRRSRGRPGDDGSRTPTALREEAPQGAPPTMSGVGIAP
jgi:hypothetical protein